MATLRPVPAFSVLITIRLLVIGTFLVSLTAEAAKVVAVLP
jgi:hypothetical protein